MENRLLDGRDEFPIIPGMGITEALAAAQEEYRAMFFRTRTQADAGEHSGRRNLAHGQEEEQQTGLRQESGPIERRRTTVVPAQRNVVTLPELIDYDPAAAAQLLIGLFLAGFAFSLTIIPCIFTLILSSPWYSSSNVSCSWLHRAWLLTHTVLQFLQFPFRVRLYRFLVQTRDRSASMTRGEFASRLHDVEKLLSWRVNQRLGITVYLVSFLGCFGVMMNFFSETRWFSTLWDHTDSVRDECNIVVLNGCVWLLISFVIRMAGTLAWGIYAFNNCFDGLLTRRSASKEMLDAMKVFKYTYGGTPIATDVCTICLQKFQLKEKLMELPCHPSHVFHAACSERWLKINKCCPLCMLDIDKNWDRN